MPVFISSHLNMKSSPMTNFLVKNLDPKIYTTVNLIIINITFFPVICCKMAKNIKICCLFT